MNFQARLKGGQPNWQGQTSGVAGAMRDAEVRRAVPFTLERGYFGWLLPAG
jgi:hypothetical protein